MNKAANRSVIALPNGQIGERYHAKSVASWPDRPTAESGLWIDVNVRTSSVAMRVGDNEPGRHAGPRQSGSSATCSTALGWQASGLARKDETDTGCMSSQRTQHESSGLDRDDAWHLVVFERLDERLTDVVHEDGGAKNPGEVRVCACPPKLRQERLESSSARFGHGPQRYRRGPLSLG